MADLDVASMLEEITSRNSLKIAEAIGAQSAISNIPGMLSATPAKTGVVPTILPTLNVSAPAATKVTPEESTLTRTPTEKVQAKAATPVSGLNIPDLVQQAVPSVDPLSTRSIEDVMSIASMLAPDVEAQPLTAEQLLGGDLFGLTAPEVTNVADTRLAQLTTKHAADASALDFIKESTGQKTAEALVKEKIQEEGQQARSKFVTESQAAENVKSQNQASLLANRKSKVDIAKVFLEGKVKAAAEAAKAISNVDQWKERKASILTAYAKTNPLAAAGIVEAIGPLEAKAALDIDKIEKTMDAATKKMYKAILSLGTPPTEEVQ